MTDTKRTLTLEVHHCVLDDGKRIKVRETFGDQSIEWSVLSRQFAETLIASRRAMFSGLIASMIRASIQ